MEEYSKSHSIPISLWVFSIGAIITAVVFIQIRSLERTRFQDSFIRESINLYNYQVQHITTKISSIEVMAALFNHFGPLKLQEFSTIASKDLTETSGIEAITYVPIVNIEDKTKIENKARKNGLDDYQITILNKDKQRVPAPWQKQYYPIFFIEPFINNKVLVGLDISSLDSLFPTLLQAQKLGKTTATPLIPNPIDNSKNTIAIVVPLYSRSSLEYSVKQQRRTIDGFMIGFLKLKELTQTNGIHNQILDLSIYDTTNNKETLIQSTCKKDTTSFNKETNNFNLISTKKHLIGSRTWLFSIGSKPEFYKIYHSYYACFSLIVGTILTCLLSIIVYVESKKKNEVKRLVDKKTKKLQQATSDLEIALNRAELAAKTKDEFLAKVSHEIRTPLNGIIGMGELLNDTELNQEQIELVNTIQLSGDNLLTIINDILDFSKIEAGHIRLKESPFSIRKEFLQFENMFKAKMQENDLVFHVEIDSNIQDVLVADAARLRQIITNLIGNSIKFTQHGAIIVLANIIKEFNSTEMLSISVIDSGIGITKEAQRTIFTPFMQAENSLARTYEGTGLGLAISAQLAELMGGTIEVHSIINVGSRFTVKLPFCPAIVDSIETNNKKNVLKTLQKPLTILLAEDNEINIRLASRIFKDRGHTVWIVRNGLEAVELYEQKIFDIVVLDLQMPVMEGMEAARHIRQIQKDKNITTPIVMLSAHATMPESIKTKDVKLDGYITKPFNRTDFLCTIEDIASKNNN